MKTFPKTILITGANRGLGFEMVKHILAKYKPDAIFSTYRDINSAEELLKIAAENSCVYPVLMDVTNPESYVLVFKQIEKITGEQGLQLLINNAGIFRFNSTKIQSLEQITKELMLEFLQVNTFGAIFVTQAFLPLLEKGGHFLKNTNNKAVIANLSSLLASNSDNKSGGYYASRCTRSALNSATKSMSIDLKDRNILVVAINPGWVQTDQGGENAPLKPEESVAGILNVIASLENSSSGSFMQYDGKVLPY